MNKFETFKLAMEKITEAQMLLQQGPTAYYVSEITGAYDYMMDKFAPFKVGDRVMLKERPDPMPEGWQSSAHFLVRGALATVKEIDCGSKGFTVHVEFDDESWIKVDQVTGTKEIVMIEPDRKHHYCFSDRPLMKV